MGYPGVEEGFAVKRHIHIGATLLLLCGLHEGAVAASEQTWAGYYGHWGYGSRFESMRPTADGGCVLAGYVSGFNEATLDAWIVKLDAAGEIEWQKMLGGPWNDFFFDVQPLQGGGLVAVGRRDHHVGASVFETYLWCVSFDMTGAVRWQRSFDLGPSYADGRDVAEAGDGAVLVLGQDYSTQPISDVVTKLTDTGGVAWQRRLRTRNPLVEIVPSSDGGWATHDGRVVMKFDADGEALWALDYGRTITSLASTADGGYVAAGRVDYEKPFHIIRLESNGAVLWSRLCAVTDAGGGIGSIAAVSGGIDGGLWLAGTGSFKWVARVDKDGSPLWATKLKQPGYVDHLRLDAVSDGTALLACKAYLPDLPVRSGGLLVRIGSVGWIESCESIVKAIDVVCKASKVNAKVRDVGTGDLSIRPSTPTVHVYRASGIRLDLCHQDRVEKR